MTESVAVSIISELPGYVNSNPKIVRIHPDKLKVSHDELLMKSLPNGAEPGHFYQDNLGRHKIISYVFDINSDEHRADLVSIGFTIEKNAVIKGLQYVLGKLIEAMKNHGVLNVEMLDEHLPVILDGLQKESRIKIGKMVFDVKAVLKQSNTTIKKKKRKRRGAML